MPPCQPWIQAPKLRGICSSPNRAITLLGLRVAHEFSTLDTYTYHVISSQSTILIEVYFLRNFSNRGRDNPQGSSRLIRIFLSES
ncbi:hypothetical protein OPQ81_011020 [Rhizoctonia solani]|nr:hypothetical protein OPQ81_011020 [Rhizoctonia solani]